MSAFGDQDMFVSLVLEGIFTLAFVGRQHYNENIFSKLRMVTFNSLDQTRLDSNHRYYICFMTISKNLLAL